MIGWAILMLAASAQPAQSRAPAVTEDQRRRFVALVQEYQLAVWPLCLSSAANAYSHHYGDRDRAFVASLEGTPLRMIYRRAVLDWREQERRIVRHCESSIPQPPPPPGTPPPPPVDPRTAAIARVQSNLRREADQVPAHFDAGDRTFAKLEALRTEILGQDGDTQ